MEADNAPSACRPVAVDAEVEEEGGGEALCGGQQQRQRRAPQARRHDEHPEGIVRSRHPQTERDEAEVRDHARVSVLDRNIDLEKQLEQMRDALNTPPTVAMSSDDTTARTQFAALEKKFEVELARVARLATNAAPATSVAASHPCPRGHLFRARRIRNT